MECNKDQNSYVNDKTVEENANLSQQAATSSENKAQVIPVKKAENQEDSNRSSAVKTISLVGCHCSCHSDKKGDVVRYELIEEESKHEIKNEQSVPALEKVASSGIRSVNLVHSEYDNDFLQSTPIPSVVEASAPPSITPAASKQLSILKEASKSSIIQKPSLPELPLAKLSHGKFCTDCGKLKTDWIYDEQQQHLEIMRRKSEEYGYEWQPPVEPEDDLSSIQTKSHETVKSLSMKTQTSIIIPQQDLSLEKKSDIDNSFVSERAYLRSKSDIEMPICNQECQLHCPKIREYDPPAPAQEYRILTVSEKLTANANAVHSIESLPPSLAAKSRADNEPRKTVQIVEPIDEKNVKEEEEKRLKEEEEKKMKAMQEEEKRIVEEEKRAKKAAEKAKKEEEIPKTPPKVILSLADIDMEDNDEQKMLEKSTQSPSVTTTQNEAAAASNALVEKELEPKIHFVEDMQEELLSRRESDNSQSDDLENPQTPKTPLPKRLSNSFEYYGTK